VIEGIVVFVSIALLILFVGTVEVVELGIVSEETFSSIALIVEFGEAVMPVVVFVSIVGTVLVALFCPIACIVLLKKFGGEGDGMMVLEVMIALEEFVEDADGWIWEGTDNVEDAVGVEDELEDEDRWTWGGIDDVEEGAGVEDKVETVGGGKAERWIAAEREVAEEIELDEGWTEDGRRWGFAGE
jgi:hypothetical protein